MLPGLRITTLKALLLLKVGMVESPGHLEFRSRIFVRVEQMGRYIISKHRDLGKYYGLLD